MLIVIYSENCSQRWKWTLTVINRIYSLLTGNENISSLQPKPLQTASSVHLNRWDLSCFMFRETSELFRPIVCFQFNPLWSHVYYFRQCGNLKQRFEKKKGGKDRSDLTVKGTKQWENGSRKRLTVRENVRLIEASFAQLFLVAVRYCTERLRQ